ncbi:Piwi domain-containing protein [Trichocoleus sp. FACHB-40]|uniref:Piwi domain-containing protein n=2 Tax=Cyanophyceae TaxID=3028117 RepID=UPI001689CF2B|nr:Piwi domain-containing protein [Trichocoleus sp. FACHB-40]
MPDFFLYKENISPLTKEDVILFDYETFDINKISENIKSSNSSYIVHLINPLHVKQSDILGINQFESVNKQIVKALKNKYSQYIIFNDLNKYTLANVLLKLGMKNKAIPWKINSIDPQDPQHIFIGIDLGHDHKTKSTNLTVTAIDNQGWLIDKFTKKGLQLNEVIDYEILLEAFLYLSHKFLNKNQQLTIHRDGILKEVGDLHKVMKKININQYNLVEVIKTGVPLIGFYSNYRGHKTYLDGFQGYYVYTENLSYLITNDQSLKTKTAPKPLKIRRIYGYKQITELTEEVYWLTKAYSQNIFEPTKLPITIQKANNLSYSGDLIQFTNQ